jgi:anti-anti-sigma factor
MAVNRRIEVTNFSGSAGEVTMVRFLDRKIIDAANIQELGDELFSLVEKEQRKNLLLNFANVEFLSSAALNKLIILDKKVKAHTGKMRLCNLKPEIYEVFAITRLNQLFDIKNTEAEALAGF